MQPKTQEPMKTTNHQQKTESLKVEPSGEGRGQQQKEDIFFPRKMI